MTATADTRPARGAFPLAGLTARRIRLASGLVLLLFVVTHYLNHALGLISLDAMEIGRQWFRALWFNLPMDALLIGSLLAHAGLGLRALYRRRNLLKMPRSEALQLVLGLAIVPLLANHVFGTRINVQLHGSDPHYAMVAAHLGHFFPEEGALQAATLLVIWVHACIGVALWLRLKPWFARAAPWLLSVALLLPLLALGGFLAAVREVEQLIEDEAVWAEMVASFKLPPAEVLAWQEVLEDWFILAFLAVIGGVLVARGARLAVLRRAGGFIVSYPEGRRVVGHRGMSILECSRAEGVPHASVCGGRGRCSTCRVRVGEGEDNLPEPSASELKVLARVGAPPKVRLACQTRPRGDVSVTPLLPPSIGTSAAGPAATYRQGVEAEIAVLFADLRGFTELSEKKLPYDVVFLLNRYFAAMGSAIEASGGRLDKFVGDGIMALFGIDAGRDGAAGTARTALAAARAMGERLAALNAELAPDLPAPLRIGIGLHYGPAIVGEMGYGRATGVTAIGDTVNTASRLEALTKEHAVQLVVSDRLARTAGIDLGAADGATRHETTVRGRRAPLAVWAVADVGALPEMAPAAAASPRRR